MAKELKQAVVQYDVNGLPQRMICQYVDTVTGEEQQTINNRDDMGSPDKQIFDNFKTMVEKHMID